MTSRIDSHQGSPNSKTDVPAILLSLPTRDGRYDSVAAAAAFSNPLNTSIPMPAVIERHRIQVNDGAGSTVEVPWYDWFSRLDKAFGNQHPGSAEWGSKGPIIGARNRSQDWAFSLIDEQCAGTRCRSYCFQIPARPSASSAPIGAFRQVGRQARADRQLSLWAVFAPRIRVLGSIEPWEHCLLRRAMGK